MDSSKEVNNIQVRDESVGLIVIRAAVQFIFSLVVWGGLLFWSAGSISWPRGWIHLSLWIVTLAANLLILLRTNRAVLAARTKRLQFETKFDQILMLLVMLPATLAIPVVAGLDAVRYQLAPIASWAIYPAVLFHVAGDAFLLWAMIVNPYLEKTVRIQKERGHHVVTTGPYAFVRHPMYAGAIMLFVAIPLILGSGCAFVPVSVVVLVIIIRMVFEERILHRDLPGYRDYAKRIRHRLLPGIW
jgi:protein-S-isoprenylcysteine O-methyltransferase Ste14